MLSNRASRQSRANQNPLALIESSWLCSVAKSYSDRLSDARQRPQQLQTAQRPSNSKMYARKPRRTPHGVARTGRTHCSVVLCMAALVVARVAVQVVALCVQPCSVPRLATALPERTVATHIRWQVATSDNLRSIADVIEAGADVDKAGKHGRTPLYEAVRNGKVDVVEGLIKAGVDVDKAAKDGDTPLYVAAQMGKVDVAVALLKAGAVVDKANEDGYTPLHVAAREGIVDVAGALIKAGADVDKGSKDGYTPLYVAAQEDMVDVVDALIKAAADGDKADKDGITPLELAIQRGYVQCAAAIRAASSKME